MSNEKGDFSSGFIVGVLAGFAGYFLTKTEEGKQMRDKFSKEWDVTKKQMVKDGVINKDTASVADFFQNAKAKITEMVGEEFMTAEIEKLKQTKPKPKKRKTTTKRTTQKEKTAKKKKMFKGL